MPPRMITGAARPQLASLRLCQNGGRAFGGLGLEAVRTDSHQATSDQRQAGEDAGDHAGGEQRRHRGLRHQHAVDDEGDRGRNQDAGRTGGGDHAGREGARIAGLDHRPGSSPSPTAAASAGPEPEMPPRIMPPGWRPWPALPRRWPTSAEAKLTMARGDAGALEDHAGQHEHRQRQQRVLGDAGIDVGRHRHHAQARESTTTAVPARPSATPSGTPAEHQREEDARTAASPCTRRPRRQAHDARRGCAARSAPTAAAARSCRSTAGCRAPAR